MLWLPQSSASLLIKPWAWPSFILDLDHISDEMSLANMTKDLPKSVDLIISLSPQRLHYQPIDIHRHNPKHWWIYLNWRIKKYFTPNSQFQTFAKDQGQHRLLLSISLNIVQDALIKTLHYQGYCIKGIVVPAYEKIRGFNKKNKHAFHDFSLVDFVIYIEKAASQLYRCVIFNRGQPYIQNLIPCANEADLMSYVGLYIKAQWNTDRHDGNVHILLGDNLENRATLVSKERYQPYGITSVHHIESDCRSLTKKPTLLFRNTLYRRFKWSKLNWRILIILCHGYGLWTLDHVIHALHHQDSWVIQHFFHPNILPKDPSPDLEARPHNKKDQAFLLNHLGPLILQKLHYPKAPCQIEWNGNDLSIGFESLTLEQQNDLTQQLTHHQNFVKSIWKSTATTNPQLQLKRNQLSD